MTNITQPLILLGPLAVLEVVEGPHCGVRHEVTGHETFMVGRAATANLRIENDPHFSRHHFLLEFNPPRCYLRDLGSSNETVVNDVTVGECDLKDGDMISVGKTRIQVHLPKGDEPTLGQTPEQRSGGAPPASALPGTIQAYDAAGLMVPSSESDVTVPGYEVVRLLGRGGMGAVYQARQKVSGRDVALKIVLPEVSSSERSKSLFLREVSVLSQVNHPRIVRFQEMGMAQGQFYFVMDYVETVDLLALLAKRSLNTRVKVACNLACQVLDGLSYAHGLGFIHRDIKPANILVSHEGKELRAKIADFGLAKNFENAGCSGMTFDGQLLGTLPFMAPEQMLNVRYAKPSVDIYSVAATLYYWLAGQYPHDFSGRKDRIVVMLEDEPTPITRHCPGLNPGLAGVLRRALARSPADRIQTATAFGSAIRESIGET